jgi:glycine oxidase
MEHVLIVGGGAIGMLTARELCTSGVRVTVLERQAVARESSWAGGGIISPLYPWRYLDSVTRLATFSQAVYPELVRQLLEDTGIDPEYEPSGMLVVAPEEESDALAWGGRLARRVERVDTATCHTLEPAMARAPASALWLPDVGQVRNPRLTRALRTDIERRGVRLLEHTPMTGLLTADDRIRGAQTADGALEADAVVVCAGAWTHDLLAQFTSVPDVRPVRGQMLLFHGQPGAVHRIVLEENRYLIPRRDGRVLFGSTLEETGFDKSTTSEAREELYQLATERFPVLARFPVERHWAGLRPGSPAGVPYIARHPQFSNLYVNAGHFRNGIVLGPASARLLADLLLERPAIVPPEPYSLTAARG